MGLSKELLIFQNVAKYKSFSKASEKLFFSQPTVTFHISQLEKELGAKLFIRDKTTSTLELTSVGEIFLDYINQIITLYDEAIEKTESIKKGELGTLKIALTGSTGYWLFPLLDNFKKKHRNVNIEIHVNFTNTILDLIKNRKVHFGFLKTETPNFVHSSLITKAVLSDESILVFSPNYKFSKLKEVTLADVNAQPIIAYARNTSFWGQILVNFDNAGLTPKITMEAYDFQIVKLFVQKSLGVAFLPRICVKEEIDKGIFKTLPIIDCPPIKRYSILVYRKDITLNDLDKWFLDMISKYSEKL